MAESVFKWTKEGQISVEHRGEKVTVNVPEWMQGDLAEKPSEFLEQIRETLDDRTIVHRILSQLVIDLRAACRPQDSKEGPEQISEQTAQSIAAGWTPKPVEPPKQQKSAKETLSEQVERMKAEGWTKKQIREYLGV